MVIKTYPSEEQGIERTADKLIELMLLTKRATETKVGAFSLRERLLFCLLSRPLPPRELMERLGMAKSNLALLASKCTDEGLIVKQKRTDDRRTLVYTLTDKGRKTVESILDEIEHKFTTVLTDEKSRSEAENSLDAVAELLSFLP